MVKLITSVLIFTMLHEQLLSQQNIAGEYSLRGVMEVGSGLQLNEDSTFQFFFSYGALDRYGSGTWTVHNNMVLLNSKPYPGKDFKLVRSTLLPNDFITISIEDNNTALYRLVYCRIKTSSGDSILNADENGVITIPSTTTRIEMLSEICPERISTFELDNKKYNTYAFNFEPWIADVFFRSFPLRFEGDHLQGKHPLLDDREYSFYKEK